MNKIKNVAIYLRLSRDEEKLGIDEALFHHRSTLISLCERNNWDFKIFEEIASSKDIEGRIQMSNLLEQVKEGQFQAVVVMDIDRLSRNEFDASNIKRILLENDTIIVTPSKQYDFNKDEDLLLLGIQSLVASQEYKQIQKRMNNAKLFHSKLGNWVNGKPPFGYVRNNETKRLEIDEEKAVHVRFIFEQLTKGATVTDVYQKLNSMGVKTNTGGKFTYNAIQRMVNYETYIGYVVNNKTLSRHKLKPRSEWIIVPNAHPAIIDEETFYRAQRYVNTYKFAKTKRANRVYPTSRLIYCGACGKTLNGQWQSNVQRFYLKTCSCGNKCYSYTPVLISIKEELAKYNEKIIAMLDSYDIEKVEEHNYELENYTKQLNKAKNALNRIEILFEEAEIDLPQYKKRKAARKEEIYVLEMQIDELKNYNPATKLQSLEELKINIQKLMSKWEWIDGEGLTGEEVNRLLHFIVEKIEWTYPKSAGSIPSIHIEYKG